VLNTVVSLAILTILFALIFKFMPSTSRRWRDVRVGAFVTAVLFEIGKFADRPVPGQERHVRVVPGRRRLVLLLAWVYYAAQIFLLGAEFTKVYANAHGSLAGAKATAATDAAAEQAKAGTDDPQALDATSGAKATDVEEAQRRVEKLSRKAESWCSN
jgi:membrane protein